MDIAEVVMRLTGPVEPVGDSRVDGIRFENLRTLCVVVDALLDRIEAVATATDDHLASVKDAKDYAVAFMRDARARVDAALPASGVPPSHGGEHDGS